MTSRLTALSTALAHLWQAQQAIDDGPNNDRLIEALNVEIIELARKVESYRHAEHSKQESR